jgi:hypothetical protein
VVFGHTVVPMSDASDWPLFSALGERSLGSPCSTIRWSGAGRSNLPGSVRDTRCWRACMPR